MREQQEFNRRQMERKEKERQKQEQEKRKEKEEEDALEQVCLSNISHYDSVTSPLLSSGPPSSPLLQPAGLHGVSDGRQPGPGVLGPASQPAGHPGLGAPHHHHDPGTQSRSVSVVSRVCQRVVMTYCLSSRSSSQRG